MRMRCTACGRLPHETCCERCHRAAWQPPEPIVELRRLRRAAGLTQHALAEAVGVSPSLVAHWEAGRSRPASSVRPLIEQVLA